MAIIRQILCDHCGRILSGREMKEQVNRPHLWIQGRMAYEDFNEDRNNWTYTFVTPPRNEQLAFCDFDCMKEYSEQKRAYWMEAREAAKAKGVDPLTIDTEVAALEQTDAPTP